MKILHVSPWYEPAWKTGGTAVAVSRLCRALSARGHDVTVLTADRGDEGSYRERRNGVRIKRYRSIAPNGAIHFCPQIAAAVRTAEADIIHAHNYHSFPLVFAALAVGDRRFVVTTHYHGGSASSVRDRLLSVYRPFGRWAVRRADTVIAVSEWERDQLAADFDVEARVIPNGLDVERFAAAEPTVRERPYLLTVGRLEAYKGVQHVIRAMAELPEYDLCIAGSGSYRDQLEQLTREAGLTEQVTFLGYVADDALPGLYAGADVYLSLSEFEAYGMTVAEALASGTPCVVREAGALQDWTANEAVVGISTVTTNAVQQAVRACDTSADPTLADRSWDSVTTRLIEAAYTVD